MNRVALLGIALLASPAFAQQPQVRCSYETCALRVVDGGDWFGSQVIVQGREGYSVAYARRSETLAELFAANESARCTMRGSKHTIAMRTGLAWLGTDLMLTGFIADIIGEGGFFSRSFFLYGGGLAVTYGVALPYQRRAATDLSNAIWWYNRSLTRSP